MYFRAVKWLLFQSSFFSFDRNTASSLEWLSDEFILKRAHKCRFYFRIKSFCV